MAKTYEFKTDEDIDTLSRTIIASETVTEKKNEEFTLEQKQNQLDNLVEQKANTEEQIVDLETEITEIKTALKIT